MTHRVKKTEIERNLKIIIKEYNKIFSEKIDNRLLLLYAKIAIIEVNGWIEETVDDIIVKEIKLKKLNKRLEGIVNNQIKKNYGINYESFVKLMVLLMGYKTYQIIENKTEKSTGIAIEEFISDLNSICKNRNKLSHTFINDHALTNINSPDITYRQFIKIYKFLKEFNKNITKQ